MNQKKIARSSMNGNVVDEIESLLYHSQSRKEISCLLQNDDGVGLTVDDENDGLLDVENLRWDDEADELNPTFEVRKNVFESTVSGFMDSNWKAYIQLMDLLDEMDVMESHHKFNCKKPSRVSHKRKQTFTKQVAEKIVSRRVLDEAMYKFKINSIKKATIKLDEDDSVVDEWSIVT